MAQRFKGRSAWDRRRRRRKGVVAPNCNIARRHILRGPYRYRPLNSSENEIRLLRLPRRRRLGNGQWDETIDAALIHVPLSYRPKYEALSYRWAYDSEASIVIDGYRVEVSKTLHSALQRLRGSKGTKLVWVDALCINQSDDEERNEQVSKMRTIYSQAAHVVAWPEEGTASSHLAFGLMQDLYDHLDDLTYIEDALSSPHRREHWTALLEILHLEYWHRIWVIQEVNSARCLSLTCGNDTMKWEQFVAVQHKFYFWLQLSNKLSTASLQLGLREKFRTSGPRILRLPPRVGGAEGLHSLTEVLTYYGCRRAEDPRDNVYALVGLTSARDDPRMPIDYSLSVRQVYINVVDYVLRSEGKLDVICSRFPYDNIHGLPSWTPDWSSIDQRFISRVLSRREWGRDFAASGTRTAKATVDKERGVLNATGFRIDKVRDLGDQIAMRSSEHLEAVIIAVLQWYRLSHSFSQPSNIDDHDQAFTRTILCESFSEKHAGGKGIPELLLVILASVPRLAQRLSLCEVIHERLQTLADWSPENDHFAETWLNRMRVALHGRRFFVSAEGRMGLCPCYWREGDVIAVLLGCATPVMMRPHEGWWELVGDVYLWDYMYGKGIEELEEGKFKLEDFEIR